MIHILLQSLNKCKILLTVCLIAVANYLPAQVVIKASADTASILIGEQIQLSVKCIVNTGQQVSFPDFKPQQQLTPGVEIVYCGKVDTTNLNDGKRQQLTRRYTITSFDSAMYSIPPFQIKVDGKEYTSQGNIGLKVSTIPVDVKHPDQFNGPHDVIEQPFKWSWTILFLSLLSLLSMIIIILLIIRLTDPKLITRKVLIKPPTPAHITAISHIEKIKASTSSDVKLYYMELTEALRTYIEERFGFSAREMTTTEIVEHLNKTGNEQALIELKDVLLTADLVKFAKHTTTLPEQDRSLVQALDYVQTTKLAPHQLPQPRIEYVSLSNKKQIMWRNIMRVTTWLLIIVTIILTAYNIGVLYCCYG